MSNTETKEVICASTVCYFFLTVADNPHKEINISNITGSLSLCALLYHIIKTPAKLVGLRVTYEESSGAKN